MAKSRRALQVEPGDVVHVVEAVDGQARAGNVGTVLLGVDAGGAVLVELETDETVAPGLQYQILPAAALDRITAGTAQRLQPGDCAAVWTAVGGKPKPLMAWIVEVLDGRVWARVRVPPGHYPPVRTVEMKRLRPWQFRRGQGESRVLPVDAVRRSRRGE